MSRGPPVWRVWEAPGPAARGSCLARQGSRAWESQPTGCFGLQPAYLLFPLPGPFTPDLPSQPSPHVTISEGQAVGISPSRPPHSSLPRSVEFFPPKDFLHVNDLDGCVLGYHPLEGPCKTLSETQCHDPRVQSRGTHHRQAWWLHSSGHTHTQELGPAPLSGSPLWAQDPTI